LHLSSQNPVSKFCLSNLQLAPLHRELESVFPARDRSVGGTGILQGAPGFEFDANLAAGPGRERGGMGGLQHATSLSGMVGAPAHVDSP
jgi:hypothetical protein